MTDRLIIAVDGETVHTIEEPHPAVKNEIELEGDGKLFATDEERVSVRLEKNGTPYIR
jgi:hypothetical protein